jgi:hypothetical protein
MEDRLSNCIGYIIHGISHKDSCYWWVTDAGMRKCHTATTPLQPPLPHSTSQLQWFACQMQKHQKMLVFVWFLYCPFDAHSLSLVRSRQGPRTCCLSQVLTLPSAAPRTHFILSLTLCWAERLGQLGQAVCWEESAWTQSSAILG